MVQELIGPAQSSNSFVVISNAILAPSIPYVELPKPKPIRGLFSPAPWSCLASVQYWIRGFPTGVGYPNKLTPNWIFPDPGVAILTSEGRVGHTGQVVSSSAETVTFRECNWKKGSCDYRTLNLTDPIIRGFYQPDAVASASDAI